MVTIKNPITIIESGSSNNPTLTIATSLNSPLAIKNYINTILAEMQEISIGSYYVINKSNWKDGSQNRMCMFNTYNGVITTGSAVRVNLSGELTVRSLDTTSALSVIAGDTFEFIKVK